MHFGRCLEALIFPNTLVCLHYSAAQRRGSVNLGALIVLYHWQFFLQHMYQYAIPSAAISEAKDQAAPPTGENPYV
jgi:hypothetical protein